ncbi:MAG: 5-bromo-4-chloroindolyl phosphate hydrolysis family protein [Maritimibacter sp.]
MAQRYGGKFSPDGAQTASERNNPVPRASPYEGKRAAKAGARVNFLFLAPLPLAISAFFGDSTTLAGKLIAFGLLILAAWLTREGVFAHEAYNARKIARRPALPRKIFGAVLLGAGLGLAGFMGGGAGNAIIFALLGAALHLFAFGLDPLKNKGMEGIDAFQTDRVARAVTEAEKHLAAMSDAILRAHDPALMRRVESFQFTARQMFRTLEDDPTDLSGARKYLTVYLKGAREATSKFADIYARSKSPETRADYVALLDDLEANFAGRTQKMLSNDHTDLNIEIDVLRERLSREGVALNPDA